MIHHLVYLLRLTSWHEVLHNIEGKDSNADNEAVLFDGSLLGLLRRKSAMVVIWNSVSSSSRLHGSRTQDNDLTVFFTCCVTLSALIDSAKRGSMFTLNTR